MKIRSLRFGLAFFVSVSLCLLGRVMGQAPALPNPLANLSPPPPASSPPPLPRQLPPSIAPAPAREPAEPAPATQVNRNQPILVPPPQPALELPAPKIGPSVPATAPRSAFAIQRLTPVVEVWRANGRSPQIPARRGDHVADAYVADNQPFLVRLQFDPSARGNAVVVRPGRGAILQGRSEVLRVNPTGECLVTLRLAENINHGHVSFHCAGLMTTLTLARSSSARVQANEDRNGGRP